MSAIFKREFKSYFTTPIGYIVLAILYFVCGIIFVMLFSDGSPQIEYVFQNIITLIVVMVLIPIITMRTMSEDRRQKTDQLMLTAPISIFSIVFGKFLAAFFVFALGFVPTFIFEIVISTYIEVDFTFYLYSLLGMFLLGALLISIGMFISSLTESPAVAAILSLTINVSSLLLTGLASFFVSQNASGLLGKILSALANGITWVVEKLTFMGVYEGFSKNIFSIPDVFYFLSVTAAFLFLSVRSLEKRRWS